MSVLELVLVCPLGSFFSETVPVITPNNAALTATRTRKPFHHDKEAIHRGVLFMSEDKMELELELDRRIGAVFAVVQALY